MHYYGTRLSENISRREPEGYLLCLNVPVARTGTQDYLPEELGLAPGPASGMRPPGRFASRNTGRGIVPVLRPPEEVFSPETIASFEGMPVTNGHPPEGVDVSNIRALQKGHAHNVRRGSGEEGDLLLADLIITDPALITAILEEGKREISCGYTYELREENGQYIQRQIRGNHVAVVDAGRAGSRVSIRDGEPPSGSPVRVTGAVSQPPGLRPGTRRSHQPENERRKHTMKKSLSKALARMAKDGDVETVAEILEEMMEPGDDAELKEGTGTAPETGDPAVTVETPEGSVIAVDEGSAAGIIERLDRIIALLTPAAADEETAEEVTEAIGEALEQAALEAEDPMAGEIASVMEEILEPVASVILEDNGEENGTPEALQAGDALRAALAAVRPALARMPLKTRRRVAGDIAARLRGAGRRGTNDSNVYAALASAGRRTAPASADLGRRIMEKRNVSYRK